MCIHASVQGALLESGGFNVIFFLSFVTFLVSTKKKCHICAIIVHNKLTLMQSRRMNGEFWA